MFRCVLWIDDGFAVYYGLMTILTGILPVDANGGLPAGLVGLVQCGDTQILDLLLKRIPPTRVCDSFAQASVNIMGAQPEQLFVLKITNMRKQIEDHTEVPDPPPLAFCARFLAGWLQHMQRSCQTNRASLLLATNTILTSALPKGLAFFCGFKATVTRDRMFKTQKTRDGKQYSGLIEPYGPIKRWAWLRSP